MQLTTPVFYNHHGSRIEPGDSLLTIGSCFSDHMGKKLAEHKFSCRSNPYGIMYNPISIAKNLSRSIDQSSIGQEEINDRQGVFFHYDFHSSFNALEPEKVQNDINESILDTSHFLTGLDWLIITLGTSIAYRHKKYDQVVANCHKIPAQAFEKYWITTEETVLALEEIITRIRINAPALKVILTVSPVRHIKEGLPENQRSKARLIEACHTLKETLPEVYYFPSYEMMIDEWRDYRFYKEDMIHPSGQAVDAIWSRFQDHFMSARSREKVKLVHQINRDMKHRPFNPSSEDHKKFLAAIERKKEEVEQAFPEVEF